MFTSAENSELPKVLLSFKPRARSEHSFTRFTYCQEFHEFYYSKFCLPDSLIFHFLPVLFKHNILLAFNCESDFTRVLVTRAFANTGLLAVD